MKYLKTYNESNSDEYYQRIDQGEFNRFVDGSSESLEYFLYPEIEKLSTFRTIKETLSKGRCVVKIDEDEIEVYKGTDEWFFVRSMVTPYRSVYYKCDQFEGLIKLLNDIESNRNKIMRYLKSYNESKSMKTITQDMVNDVSDMFLLYTEKFGLKQVESIWDDKWQYVDYCVYEVSIKNNKRANDFTRKYRGIEIPDSISISVLLLGEYSDFDEKPFRKEIELFIERLRKMGYDGRISNKRNSDALLEILIYPNQLYRESNESISNNDFYTEMTYVEYVNHRDNENNKYEKFKKEEIDSLSKVCNVYPRDYITISFVVEKYEAICDIVKLVDEWYYISMTITQVGKSKHGYRQKFFKCDQFDGLLNLINDFKNKNLDISTSSYYQVANVYVGESINNDEYYTKITQREYHDIAEVSLPPYLKDFNKVEKRLIDDTLKNDKTINYEFSKFFARVYIQIKLNWIRKLVTTSSKVVITKTNDDWFYCEIYEDHEHRSKINERYYKCDQIEGLIEFLKNLKQIIK